MASQWSDAGRADFATAGVSGRTLRAMLVTADPSIQNKTTVSALTGEAAAAGYSRQTLTTVAVVNDTTNHKARISADPVNFGSPAVGETYVGVVVFRRVGGSDVAANDIPWVFIDSNDLPSNGAAVTFTPDNTNGVGSI